MEQILAIRAPIVGKVVSNDAYNNTVHTQQHKSDDHEHTDGQSWQGQALFWHQIKSGHFAGPRCHLDVCSTTAGLCRAGLSCSDSALFKYNKWGHGPEFRQFSQSIHFNLKVVRDLKFEHLHI